ncbi:hypothetical protein H5410_053652 [Solanum commersonii]|uniref:Putative plant transposon protein domain-containing protein n=1 Tax=Solanum commersonii TaxID=4109 RepID=A0A9J5X429_SOLCO|nr:hypothetical protein H5410_053652 [Solanum commersonii]
MAPKAKNVAGSKRSRKGEAFGFGNQEPIQKFGKKEVEQYVGLRFIFDHPRDCNLSLVREFYANWLTKTNYKIVPIRGKDVKFNATILNEFLGTPNCDSDDFNTLKDNPPYRDIQHTLCGVESTARWERSKDIGRHNTLNFANFNQIARVWLKIVCSVLLSAKHLTEITRDRVVLVYILMKGMPINVEAILGQNMMKFQNNMRWHFCYKGLITHFLRAQGIEKEGVDLTIAFQLDLTSKLVDVTRTEALGMSHGPILSAQERQARDDSVMARMFDMAKLQLRIRGRPITDDVLYRIGPAFLEPLDDDEATADEVMDDEEDDADGDECLDGVQWRLGSGPGCTSTDPVPFRMNSDEFTHVNETNFCRSDPIEINSDTPIIPEKVYERHYGNYQENEEDLDDTPPSPDLNSIEVPPQEDNLSVGTSCLPIVPTRGSTGGLKKYLINKRSKEWFAYISSLDVCENSNIETSARGSNMVQGELNTLNPSGPLTHRTYNKDRDHENFAKMVVVCGLPFSFGEHPGFIAYIRDTYNPSFKGLSRSMVKRDIFEFQEKHCQYLRAYFEIMDCRVAITTNMGRSPNGFDYLTVTAH